MSARMITGEGDFTVIDAGKVDATGPGRLEITLPRAGQSIDLQKRP